MYMYCYHTVISQITGIQDFQDLQRLESCLRDDVFHSTLNWQTEKQFQEGVQKALKVLRLGAEMGYWDHLNSDQEGSNHVSSL